MGGARAFALALLVCFPAAVLSGCSGDETAKLAAQQIFRMGVVQPGDYSPDDLVHGVHGRLLTAAWNVFDPLVKVDRELRPIPAMAEGWEVSADGLTVTFHLRRDGRWTNGDPLTAGDYAFGMKHNFFPSEESGGPYPSLTGIVGMEAYTQCDVRQRRDCMTLWDDVGVTALDDHTLEVRLELPDPFFVATIGGVNCSCFVALHEQTVERYGAEWAEPEHIVTSGPFTIAERDDESVTVVKNENWRDADSVTLERIEIRYFRDEGGADRALDRGEIDINVSPGIDVAPELLSNYPKLTTRWITLLQRDIPDPRQRRAMALALDRRALVGNEPGRPATSLTTERVPGFERIASDFLRQESQVDQARVLLAAAEDLRSNVTLWIPDASEARATAAYVKESWSALGIETSVKAVPVDQYWELAAEGRLEDAYLGGWEYEYPDPGYLLELFQCDHPYKATAFCDPIYDRVLGRASQEADEGARLGLYAEAEALLTGPDGAMSLVPYVWPDNVVAERRSVRETFELNAAGQVDFTKVQIAAG